LKGDAFNGEEYGTVQHDVIYEEDFLSAKGYQQALGGHGYKFSTSAGAGGRVLRRGIEGRVLP